MEKDSQPERTDITKEEYKGPSTAVTVAGHGTLEHLAYALTGLAGIGLGAYVFHKPAKSLVEGARELALKWKLPADANANWSQQAVIKSKQGCSKLLNGIFGDKEIAEALRSKECANAKHAEWFDSVATDKERGFGNALFSHTLGILPGIGKLVKSGLKNADERTANAITVGGIAGALGYAGGWGKALLLGGMHGNKGKHQFQRAQEEIKNLREDNADLNHINDELHAKYVRAATRLNTIERDSAMRAEEAASFASTENAAQQTPAPKPEVQLDTAQHMGKLAQPELSANLA